MQTLKQNAEMRRAKAAELKAAGHSVKEIAELLGAPLGGIYRDLRIVERKKRAEAREQAQKKAEPPPPESKAELEPLILQELPKQNRASQALAKFKEADDAAREAEREILRAAADYRAPKIANVKQRIAELEKYFREVALPFCRKIEGNPAGKHPQIAELLFAIRAHFGIPSDLRVKIQEIEKISLAELLRCGPNWKVLLRSRLSKLDCGAIEKTVLRQMKQVDHYLEQAEATGRIAAMVGVLRGGQALPKPAPREKPTKVILNIDPA